MKTICQIVLGLSILFNLVASFLGLLRGDDDAFKFFGLTALVFLSLFFHSEKIAGFLKNKEE